MEALIGLTVFLGLVWLFSNSGEFKQTLRKTVVYGVIWIVIIGGSILLIVDAKDERQHIAMQAAEQRVWAPQAPAVVPTDVIAVAVPARPAQPVACPSPYMFNEAGVLVRRPGC